MDSNVIIPALISGFVGTLTSVMVFLGLRYSRQAESEDRKIERQLTVREKAHEAEMAAMSLWRQDQAKAFVEMKRERDEAYNDRLDAINERRAVMARLEEHERKYAILESSVADVKRENTEIKRENSEMKERIKSLERQLLNAHNQIDALQKHGCNGGTT